MSKIFFHNICVTPQSDAVFLDFGDFLAHHFEDFPVVRNLLLLIDFVLFQHLGDDFKHLKESVR